MSLMVKKASFPYKVVTASEAVVIKVEHVSEPPRGLITKQTEDPSLVFDLVVLGWGLRMHF